MKAWKESIIKARQDKDAEFKDSPTSPMAGKQRLTVKAGQTTFVAANRGEIALSDQKVPKARFSLEGAKGTWRWERIDAGATCRAGDKDLKPGSALQDYVTFRLGKLTLAAYPAGENLILLVFDPERPQIKHFSHLFYFRPDPGYAVPAKLEKFQEITKMTMLTSQNLEKTFYRFARIHFRIKGKALSLTAFKFSLQGPGSDILFIPFRDTTSGKETYAVGRFLEIPEPQTADFILDFNLCFNPLCNYSPAYNCPFPPLENFLDAAIRAGEKTYPH